MWRIFTTTASGGYLISSPGNKIFATPATISGSIGVISLMPNLSGLLKHLEIDTDTVTMAESADFPNIFRPLSETELTHISNLVMEESGAGSRRVIEAW